MPLSCEELQNVRVDKELQDIECQDPSEDAF